MTRIRTTTRTASTEDATCLCRPKPYVLAAFRNGTLVTVTRMHDLAEKGRSQGCPIAPEPLNPKDW